MNPLYVYIKSSNEHFIVTVPILNKIRNEHIIDVLMNGQEHKYEVISEINENTFRSFWNYMTNGDPPVINANNYDEYRQLSDEFGVLNEEIQDSSNPLNLINMLNQPNENKKSIEKLIAQKLDFIIENFPNNLQNVEINSLYNIFHHDERVLQNHDRAYLFIKNSAQNLNQNFFILLKCLDAEKFNDKDNLYDSFKNRQEHLDFCPQNLFNVINKKIDDLEQSNNKLQADLSIQNEKTNRIENIKGRLSGLISRAQGIISQKQFQIVNNFNTNMGNGNIFDALNKISAEVKQTGVAWDDMQKNQFQQLVQIVTELSNLNLNY